MAGKKESTFVNMVLVLFIVTLVASASLGYVYELTKGPIAAAKLAKKLKAIKEVVPAFDNNPDADMYEMEMPDGGKLEFYPAKKGDELVGTAVKSYTKKGFSGLVWLMVGLKPDGSIQKVAVLEHKETPGLGTKMDAPFFKDQFNDKDPSKTNLTVTKDGGDIDAITAATISSRAFCDAVQKAYDAYAQKNMGGGAGEVETFTSASPQADNLKKGGSN